MDKFYCYAVRKDGRFYNMETGQFSEFLMGDCIFDSKENAEKTAEETGGELKELVCPKS